MLDMPPSVWKRISILLLLGTLFIEQAAAAPGWWDRLWADDQEGIKQPHNDKKLIKLSTPFSKDIFHNIKKLFELLLSRFNMYLEP